MDTMEANATSSSGGENGHGMKLRPRRSALSDISNSIVQQFSNMTKKVIPRKRKLSGGVEEPIEPETQSTSQETASSPAPSTSSAQGQHMNDLMEMVNNPAFAEPAPKRFKSQDEKDSEFYGYRVPPRIKRKVALQTRCADPCQCMDILDDMYSFYNDQQDVYHPRKFFTSQTDINMKMRTILVDWIVEVHSKYKLQPPTLWLTVNIIDRYLAQVTLPRQRVQLAGITALFIACKFEEINAPEVRDCVYLTDNAYQRQDVLEMETQILTKLDFQLLVPTVYHFLIRLLNRIGATERLRLIASFTAERSLQEQDIFDFSSKVYASAAVYVALRTVHMDKGTDFKFWTPALEEESGLKEDDIYACARVLSTRNMEIPQPQQNSRRKIDAVRKKYATKNMHFISNLAFPVL